MRVGGRSGGECSGSDLDQDLPKAPKNPPKARSGAGRCALTEVSERGDIEAAKSEHQLNRKYRSDKSFDDSDLFKWAASINPKKGQVRVYPDGVETYPRSMECFGEACSTHDKCVDDHCQCPCHESQWDGPKDVMISSAIGYRTAFCIGKGANHNNCHDLQCVCECHEGEARVRRLALMKRLHDKSKGIEKAVVL